MFALRNRHEAKPIFLNKTYSKKSTRRRSFDQAPKIQAPDLDEKSISRYVTERACYRKAFTTPLRYKNLIYKVLHKASKRFGIKIYQQAICGNHIHLLIWGRQRFAIQNFFRVVAGHIAQKILEQVPLLERENKQKQARAGNALNPKYQRKFWDALLYSRWVSWGRDFSNVMNYIERNTLEALGWIPYKRTISRYTAKRGAMPPHLAG